MSSCFSDEVNDLSKVSWRAWPVSTSFSGQLKHDLRRALEAQTNRCRKEPNRLPPGLLPPCSRETPKHAAPKSLPALAPRPQCCDPLTDHCKQACACAPGATAVRSRG